MNETGMACGSKERRGAYKVLVEKPEGKNHLENPSVDRRIILKWMSKKWDGSA
jgi:hypothetical protein